MEYLRQLAYEIVNTTQKEESNDNLDFLVDTILPYCVEHNEDNEAVDLLMEMDQLHKIVDQTTDRNFTKISKYIQACAPYCGDQEEQEGAYKIIFKIYMKFEKYPESLHIAQKLNQQELVDECMGACKDLTVKK